MKEILDWALLVSYWKSFGAFLLTAYPRARLPVQQSFKKNNCWPLITHSDEILTYYRPNFVPLRKIKDLHNNLENQRPFSQSSNGNLKLNWLIMLLKTSSTSANSIPHGSSFDQLDLSMGCGLQMFRKQTLYVILNWLVTLLKTLAACLLTGYPKVQVLTSLHWTVTVEDYCSWLFRVEEKLPCKFPWHLMWTQLWSLGHFWPGIWGKLDIHRYNIVGPLLASIYLLYP